MADKSPVTNCTVVAKHDAPEDPSDLHPSQPLVPVHRKKMGSSRRMRGRENFRSAETESYLRFEEEVKEKCESNACTEIAQMETHHERIVHNVSEADQMHSVFTSDRQSENQRPRRLQNKGDSSEVEQVDGVEFKDYSHTLDEHSMNVKHLTSRKEDMERDESLGRGLKLIPQEALTDKCSPCVITNELISAFPPKALVHISGSKEEEFLEKSVEENEFVQTRDFEAEYLDVNKQDVQSGQMKKGLNRSGNKRRLGSSRKNYRKHQITERDNLEICHGGLAPKDQPTPEMDHEKLRQVSDLSVDQCPALVGAMFSSEIHKNCMKDISDEHRGETSIEADSSNEWMKTKLRGLDGSETTRGDEVGSAEGEQIQLQRAQKGNTMEKVIDGGAGSPTKSSQPIDIANDIFKSEILGISSGASVINSYSVLTECVKEEEKPPETEITNKAFQKAPSVFPINQEQEVPDSEEADSKEKEEIMQIKHLSHDESAVTTMSLLEQAEGKNIQSVSYDKSEFSESLKVQGNDSIMTHCDMEGLISESADLQEEIQELLEQLEDETKKECEHISEAARSKMLKDDDPNTEGINSKQDVLSDFDEAPISPFIRQIVESNTDRDDSADFQSVHDKKTNSQDELEAVSLEINDKHSNSKSTDNGGTQQFDGVNDTHEGQTEQTPNEKTHRLESDIRTTETLALVDSTLQAQSSETQSDTVVNTRRRRKLGSSRRKGGSEQANAKSESGVNTVRNESPEKSKVEDNDGNGYREVSKNHTEKSESAHISGQLTVSHTSINPVQSFPPSAVGDELNTQSVSSSTDGHNMQPSKVDDFSCKAQRDKSSCDTESSEQEVSAENIFMLNSENTHDGLHTVNGRKKIQLKLSHPGQKRQKMGSTCKGSFNKEVLERGETPERAVAVEHEHLPPFLEEELGQTNPHTSTHDVKNDTHSSSIDCNLSHSRRDSNREQAAIPNVDVVSSLPLTNVADVTEHERTVDVSVHTSLQPRFTNPELQVISEENKYPPHSESEVVETLTVDKKGEEAPFLNAGVEFPSLTSKSANTRRKISSRRRNPHFYAKEDEVCPNHEENEATEKETLDQSKAIDNVSGSQQKPPPTVAQNREVEEENPVSKAGAHTLYDEWEVNPVQTREEIPAFPKQQMETKDQVDPGYVTPPSCEGHTLSEQTGAQRRRKFGSRRQLQGNRSDKDQSAKTLNTHQESEDRSVSQDGGVKETEEDKGSKCPDEDSKGDERSMAPLSTLTKAEENSSTVGKQSPEKLRTGGGDIQNTFPPKADSNSYLYDVVMIGECYVGKTSFIRRAQSGKFSLDVPSTVGVDFCLWPVVVEGKHVVLRVWDTAGQERFRSLTRQMFHRAQAFLLMYDISDFPSFSSVTYWVNCIQESSGENGITLLIGNKCDSAQRQVRTEQGETLAKEYKLVFSECSAASGENVIECLETVARMLCQRSEPKGDAASLPNKGKQTNRLRCC